MSGCTFKPNEAEIKWGNACNLMEELVEKRDTERLLELYKENINKMVLCGSVLRDAVLKNDTDTVRYLVEECRIDNSKAKFWVDEDTNDEITKIMESE